MSSQSLSKVLPLEVFWDHKKWQGVGAGNWSLRASCAKIQAYLGDDSFIYLSESYLKSGFIQELERGQSDYKKLDPSLKWRILNFLLVKLSTYLMNQYMAANTQSQKMILANTMQRLFRFL
jgi:hypothetical protein